MERPLTPSLLISFPQRNSSSSASKHRVLHAEQAFSLVEILVAIAIVMLFLVLAVNIATDMLGQSNTMNTKIRSNLQARLVMDWITRDIQTALIRKDGGEWLRMEPFTLDSAIELPVCRLMLFSQAGEMHPDPPDTALTLSGPSAVIYDVDYRDPTSQADTPASTTLFRYALDPRETFRLGFVANTPENLQKDVWQSVLENGVSDIEAKNLLITNIAGFQVSFEFLTANGTTVKSLATETFSAGVSGKIRTGSGPSAAEYPGARVLSVEVTLWLLDPSGVRTLTQGGTKENLFTRYSYPFTRKITLQNQ